MTRTRTRILLLYQARLTLRLTVLAAVTALYFGWDKAFDAARGGFFDVLSPMHLLWALWMVDMAFQLFPSRNLLAMGCQKMFPRHAKPSGETPTPAQWSAWRRENRRGTRTVALSWLVLAAGIAALRFSGVFQAEELVLLSTVFYVCDLVCVLFFCPFQTFLMKNRCCVNCRIFAWGSWMMAAPLIFIIHWFSWSLVAMGLVVLIVWEVRYRRYPERFWLGSNRLLQCAHCREQLCRYKLPRSPRFR